MTDKATAESSGADAGKNQQKTIMKKSVAVEEQVHVHPLVLLSVVDHYNRVAKDTRKRSVGIILGERRKGGIIEATNSFAVPFEED